MSDILKELKEQINTLRPHASPYEQFLYNIIFDLIEYIEQHRHTGYYEYCGDSYVETERPTSKSWVNEGYDKMERILQEKYK